MNLQLHIRPGDALFAVPHYTPIRTVAEDTAICVGEIRADKRCKIGMRFALERAEKTGTVCYVLAFREDRLVDAVQVHGDMHILASNSMTIRDVEARASA